MSLTWYAVNNGARVEDLPDLEALGIRMVSRSDRPMVAYRDAASGHLLVEVGIVSVWRDGSIRIRPRSDAPPIAVEALVRTALDCLERELHRRDSWAYYRATASRPGYWSAVIMVAPPEGVSVFEAHAAVLRPAHHEPTDLDIAAERHPRLPANA